MAGYAPPKRKVNSNVDSEDVFLNDVLERYTYWKRIASEKEKEKIDATKEKEYAEAFRLLLNQFSKIEEKETDASK